jgi:hypothetical protein
MWYEIIDRSGNQDGFFPTRESFLVYIKGMFKTDFYGDEFVYRPGVDNLVGINRFLSSCCHSWNDKQIEWENWVSNKYQYIDYKFMIKDAYGRIQNIPDLAVAAWNTQESKEEPYQRHLFMDDGLPWWDGNPKWELRAKRCRHMDWGRPQRRGYLQQKRAGYAPELIPYIRGKKRPRAMMWQEGRGRHHYRTPTTWKQRKLKKQYMERIIYGKR